MAYNIDSEPIHISPYDIGRFAAWLNLPPAFPLTHPCLQGACSIQPQRDRVHESSAGLTSAIR